MMLAGNWEDRLTVYYELRAQFQPTMKDDWADFDQKISSYRGTQMIYIQRPTVLAP